MESKIEEKVKYYFKNNISNNHFNDFSIPINEFEELLKNVCGKISNPPYKNSFKLYGINNKFFKIFQDGSCFGYNLKKAELNKIDNFYQIKTIQNQIYNDDFAGLKVYWIEEYYEEIIFKLDENVNLVFSKMNDIPRNHVEYSIYIEPKNISYDIKKNSQFILNIIS